MSNTDLEFYCGKVIKANKILPNQGRSIPFFGKDAKLLSSQYEVKNYYGKNMDGVKCNYGDSPYRDDPRPMTIGDKLMFTVLFPLACIFTIVFLIMVKIGGFSFMGTSGKNGKPNFAERMAGG